MKEFIYNNARNRKTATGANQDESIAFHIACSNQEVLQGVEKILRKQGIVGVTDLTGNINYLIDGRWGPQLASRRVVELSSLIRKRRKDMNGKRLVEASIIVDACLDSLLLRRHLRGFVLLRQIMIAIYLDGGLLTPLAKTVFPEAAKIFNSSIAHVERNLRYLFDKLGEDESFIRAAISTKGDLPAYVYDEKKKAKKRLLFEADASYSIRNCLSRLADLLNEQANNYFAGLEPDYDHLLDSDLNELEIADEGEDDWD